ncbi:kinesin-like protein Nod [Phlebotomus argentipes]|uniref:kinesin-like protein Nod n=1 Tax=Phlebotomus argentipes TaxID=94469 RepID=UPI002893304C|nr:kinesin-like protein Nod [Phlebotomus argentipes]
MDNDNCAVKIAVRERPFNDFEVQSGCKESAVEVHSSNHNIIIVDDQPFVFDHVFGPETSQEQVYRDLVAPLIDKMILGFHCTVLAYGHSGNGKTFTMGLHRNLLSDENSGLITRSISAVCARVQEQCEVSEEQENLPELAVSYIEIYNEKVYDLLSRNFTEPVNMKMYKYQGCQKERILDAQEAFEVLKEGNKNRHVRPTKMNANSSRSHAIFTIYISVRKSKTCTINSAFNFVDLAGSEGIRKTEHKGLALAEGVNINQGLLSMGRILQAISSGDKLIPYRDSILTTVLQDSLNKNCYLTLLACISPSMANTNETLNTLRFAKNAKSMKNNPQINLIITEIQNARRNTPTKPPVTPRQRQTMNALKDTTKKAAVKTPFHNRTFTTPGAKSWMANGRVVRKRSDVRNPPLSDTSFAAGNVSTSTEKPEEPEAPLRLEPSLTSVAFSPIIRRHVEQLEARLGERMQNMINTMTPQVARQELVASTPNPSRNQEFPCNLDEIKKELQQIVRTEISGFLRRPSVAEEEENLAQAEEEEAQNVTFDVVIPDIPTTEFPVQPGMFGVVQNTEASEEPQRKKPRREETVKSHGLNESVRRSARIAAIASTSVLQESVRKLPTPKKLHRTKRTRDVDILQGLLDATEAAKGRKSRAKSVLKEEILKIINTGNLKQLQLLSQIGLKTAFHIINHRTVNGKFKSLNEVSKLAIWRGKTWNRFLQMNNLE